MESCQSGNLMKREFPDRFPMKNVQAELDVFSLYISLI